MKDNCIAEDSYSNKLDKEIIEEYSKKGKLVKGFLPFPTYDMVQSGYPKPDHGIMVPRHHNGSNANGELLPSTGMWVELSDVVEFLKSKNIEL